MKIVFFSWPQYSHTTAAIPIIDALLGLGVEVYLFINSDFIPIFNNKKLTFISYTVDKSEIDDLRNEAIEKGVLTSNINSVQSLLDREYIIQKLDVKHHLLYCKDVFEQVTAINPDIIIRDAVAMFGKMVGAKLNKRVIGFSTMLYISKEYLFTSPREILSKLYGIDLGFLSHTEAYELFEKLELMHQNIANEFQIPGLSVFRMFDPTDYINIIFGSMALIPYPPNPDTYFVSRLPVVEREKKTYNREKTENIIYVSTGSTIRSDSTFYNRIINAFKDTEYTVIISIPQNSGDLKINNLPQNITIERFVNQDEILSKASLFITHGGFNSICESIFYEVPMIIRPLVTDSFINSHIIETLGLGKELEPESFFSDKGYIRRLCESVLDDKEMKRKLAIAAKRFCDEPPATYVIGKVVGICEKDLQATEGSSQGVDKYE